MEILLLMICVMLSGADGWESIEEFGKNKLEWLRKFAAFTHGMPSPDVIADVISRLNPKTFQACFSSWTSVPSPLPAKRIRAPHEWT